jgi:hypothetical protein
MPLGLSQVLDLDREKFKFLEKKLDQSKSFQLSLAEY